LTELKSNLRDRFENVKDTGKKELDIVKTSFKTLVELKPVPAVTNIIADTIGNARDLLNTQAGIFRRWID